MSVVQRRDGQSNDEFGPEGAVAPTGMAGQSAHPARSGHDLRQVVTAPGVSGATPSRSASPREPDEGEVTSPSLVAARSGLLPIPDDDLDKLRQGSEASASSGTLALALFAFMLLSALAVGVSGWGRAFDSQPGAEGAPAHASATDVELPPAAPAEQIVRRVLSRLPEDPEQASSALLGYAQSYAKEQRPGLAEMLLGHALRLQVTNARAAFELSRLRLQQGDYDGAETWAAHALALEPNDGEFQALDAQLKVKRGAQP